MKNLERAVEVCVDVANHWLADDTGPPPASMASASARLAAKSVLPAELAEKKAKTIGLWNLSVHDCENLAYARIFEALSDLSGFEEFARAVLPALGQV